MALQIGEVICRDVVCYFCATSDGKERRFHVTLVRGNLEYGRRGEWRTHIGTAYSRIVVYIHKTGTRVFVYNINILDEISGIVQISLMCAWSRRVDRPI
jgi:hypothetical protein